MPQPASQFSSTPPLPVGYVLDAGGAPPLPPGYSLDGQAKQDQPMSQARHGDYLSKTEDFINDAGNGIVKGAGKLPLLISKGLNKIPYIGETLAPVAGVKMFEHATKLNNPGEMTGAALEQAGEMALTGGPLRAGATALAAKLATKLPAAASFAAPALRIGAEAINSGGNALLHGQNVGPAAAAGAGGAAVGEGLPLAAPWLKKQAIAQYERVLQPTTKVNKNITQRVVPELLNRNQMAVTRGGLQRVADANVDSLGSQIDQAVTGMPKPPAYNGALPQPLSKSSQNIIDHLETYKQGFQVNGAQVDPDAINKATELQGIIRDLGPDVSYQDMNKVRQIWDKKVAQAGGYAGKTMSEGSMLSAQKEGANAIRKELASQSPDIQKINKQFHFWKGVSDVLEDTAQRKTGQFGGLGKLVAPLAGFSGGMAHGGVAQGAEYAAALLALNHAVQSTAWRTTSAVAKNQIANAMMSGRAGEVARLAGRITAAASGSSSTQSTGQQ